MWRVTDLIPEDLDCYIQVSQNQGRVLYMRKDLLEILKCHESYLS